MKVFPRDDNMRKLLKHPSAGGFGETDGADWPEDQFTTRRIQDGDVTTTEKPAELTVAPEPKKSKKNE